MCVTRIFRMCHQIIDYEVKCYQNVAREVGDRNRATILMHILIG